VGVLDHSAGVAVDDEARSSATLSPSASRPPPPSIRLIEPLSAVDAGFVGSVGFYGRVGMLAMLAAALAGVLFIRLWSLQVLNGPRYEAAAGRQAFRAVTLPAARGRIVDSNGRVLADTKGRLVVEALPSALGRGSGTSWRPSRRGRAVLQSLAVLTETPLHTLVRRIRTGLVRSPYTPPVVVERLRAPLDAYLEERARRFPGLRVDVLPERQYPQGALGGEFLGLLGEVDARQLRERAYRGYRAGDVIGRSGVEATYDRLLNAGPRRAVVPVDALGRAQGPLRVLPPRRHPRSLRLSIDARLQRAAERAIRSGLALAHRAGHADARAGAAVVMNPRTGAIYALASYPDFNQVAAARDPARLVGGGVPGQPLLNRAVQGAYPLGSTFKPIVAEAALASGLITPSSVVPCTGSLTVGSVVFRNVEAGANSLLTLPQALSISCDTWFYRLGTAFYASRPLAMQAWARRLGFGAGTGIDLPGEAAGVVPTPAWLRKTFRAPERPWYPGDSVNLSIGQGFLTATPLQLAVAYSALANGGTLVRPHVADAVLAPGGRVLRRLRFPPVRRVPLAGLQAIRDGLYMATHEGTSAAVFGDFPVAVAGKTGTAQTGSGSDDSWFASWAPAGRPRVVVVVLIEHGGFGAEAAAPAAREIYSAFFRVRPQGGREG
jgi:penicillin-binding protein 2